VKIDLYEKVFLALSAVMLVAFGVFLFLAVSGHGIVLPGPVGKVDPRTVVGAAPFDNPGVQALGEGALVTMVARMYIYQPNPVEVPAGLPVTFQITSPDVIHGFKVVGTTINAMVLPGEITAVTYTFQQPGEYDILCHEYCGTGHQTMAGKVVVVPEAQWRQSLGPVDAAGPSTGGGS
jgi:cytochrome c oxidase subunit II